MQPGITLRLPNESRLEFDDQQRLIEGADQIDFAGPRIVIGNPVQHDPKATRLKSSAESFLDALRFKLSLLASRTQTSKVVDGCRAVGYESSEQLAIIPRQIYVIQYKRAKYVARDEDVPGAEVGVKIAPRPAQIFPKSIAHSSLLASIVTAKFVDALPLYRQEKIFARDGITLGRQTMAGLLIQLQTPLQPVAAALQDLLRRGPVVHVDETPVQVPREPGRENTHAPTARCRRAKAPDCRGSTPSSRLHLRGTHGPWRSPTIYRGSFEPGQRVCYLREQPRRFYPEGWLVRIGSDPRPTQGESTARRR